MTIEKLGLGQPRGKGWGGVKETSAPGPLSCQGAHSGSWLEIPLGGEVLLELWSGPQWGMFPEQRLQRATPKVPREVWGGKALPARPSCPPVWTCPGRQRDGESHRGGSGHRTDLHWHLSSGGDPRCRAAAVVLCSLSVPSVSRSCSTCLPWKDLSFLLTWNLEMPAGCFLTVFPPRVLGPELP